MTLNLSEIDRTLSRFFRLGKAERAELLDSITSDCIVSESTVIVSDVNEFNFLLKTLQKVLFPEEIEKSEVENGKES